MKEPKTTTRQKKNKKAFVKSVIVRRINEQKKPCDVINVTVL